MNRLFTSIMVAGCLLSAPAISRGEIVDRIIATVNDEVITLSDFYVALPIFVQLNQIPQSALASAQGQRDLAELVFRELIDLRLLDQEAQQHELQIEAPIVDQYIDRISNQMNVTTDQLRERLAAEGIAFDDFHEFIRLELTKLRVINVMVTSGISVSDAEVDAIFYERYPEGAVEFLMDISQILLVPPRDADPEQVEETRQQAEAIRSRILSGEDFEELAREYSQDPSHRRGGHMGTVRRGQLPRDFEDRVLHLQPGDVSEVFQSRFGFHIVRLNELREESTMDVDAIREQIYREIQLSKQNQEIERYLANLHQDNMVQIQFDPTELIE